MYIALRAFEVSLEQMVVFELFYLTHTVPMNSVWGNKQWIELLYMTQNTLVGFDVIVDVKHLRKACFSEPNTFLASKPSTM